MVTPVTTVVTDWPTQPDSPYKGRTDGGSPLNSRPTGSVSITGVITDGEVLTAVSTLADADTIGTLHYQWVNSASGNIGTDSSTYTLQTSDVGDTISVVVTYTDGSAQAESYTSASTTTVDGTPGENYMANGDVNWLNPPTLDSASPYSITGGDVVIQFKSITQSPEWAINISSADSVLIENCDIDESNYTSGTTVGGGINLYYCNNITIRNNRIRNSNVSVSNQGQGIFMDHPSGSLLVEGNWIEECSSNIVTIGQGDSTTDQWIVRGNFLKDCHRTGLSGGWPGGDWVQMLYLGGVRDVWIEDNVMRLTHDLSHDREDGISIWTSTGSAAYPIRIRRNKLYGHGSSTSATGIMVGDRSSGTTEIQHIYCEDNDLVDAMGIGVTCGHNHKVTGNRIFCSRNNPYSEYLWAAFGPRRYGNARPGELYNIELSDNQSFLWSTMNDYPVERSTDFRDDGYDGYTPNHGQCIGGPSNIPCPGDPSGPYLGSNNSYNHSAFDAVGTDMIAGNAGYDLIPIPTAWAYWEPA